MTEQDKGEEIRSPITEISDSLAIIAAAIAEVVATCPPDLPSEAPSEPALHTRDLQTVLEDLHKHATECGDVKALLLVHEAATAWAITRGMAALALGVES